MENNEKITLSASQIAQMNFDQSLDREVTATIALIGDFLEQPNTDLENIAKKIDISVEEMKQIDENPDILKDKSYSLVAKLKKLAAEDFVKTSATRFPYLIKIARKVDTGTVDYSDFLTEWTRIMDSLDDATKRKAFDSVIRMHPLELMDIVREIDLKHWLE